MSSSLQDAAVSAARSCASAIRWRSVLLATLLAVLGAAALGPMFITPFPIVLGRMLVIALLLLLVFTAAGAWQLPGVPRWLAQVVAVVLAAPLATFVVYLPAVGGNAAEVLANEWRKQGFILITGTVLVVAPLIALGALYRERDAQARNQSLRFELERSTLQTQALDARLRLLHAQIEPHFLFNTLANVQALVESKSDRAAPVLGSLIAYLRAAMPRLESTHSTLGNEAALARAYLELMHMRMPDRLSFEVDVGPDLAAELFPPMALLTLVENAVRHGIDPAENGGRIEVRAWRDADADGARRHVSVRDSGVGMDEAAAPGIGLVNLRARLAAFYSAGASLELTEVRPHGVLAEIVFETRAVAAQRGDA